MQLQYQDAPITMLNDEANDNNRMVWDLDNTYCMSLADGEYSVRYDALNHDSDNRMIGLCIVLNHTIRPV